MDVRPRKGFCVMLININDLTCSCLLLLGPGPAASPRGAGGAAGEPWTSHLPQPPPSGRPPPSRGDFDRTSSLFTPRYFPWATAPTRTGWLSAWKAAMWRSCTSASRRSTSCTFTRAVCCPSNLLPAVCLLGAGWDSGRWGRVAKCTAKPETRTRQQAGRLVKSEPQINNKSFLSIRNPKHARDVLTLKCN